MSHKSIELKRTIMYRLLWLFVFIILPALCFGNGEDTLFLQSSYKNKQGKRVYKILKDGGHLYAIGDYTQKFSLPGKGFDLEKEFQNVGMGRDGLIAGENLYVVSRKNGAGNKYTLVPDVMLDFEDNISNFESNKGPFDSYSHEGIAFVDETGGPCPNLGFHSARLSSSDNHEALLKKSINTTSEAFVSLWINFENLNNSLTYIPLLGNDSVELLSVAAYSQNNQVYLGVNVMGKVEWIKATDINSNEWYNLKIHINIDGVELAYRSKECGRWIPIIRESHGLKDIGISNLYLGIRSQGESIVYVDDYYYHPTDIDKMSYINGMFSIYDKNSLELKSQMHLDIRPNSIAVHGNYLYLCCLRGINVYDISDTDNPVLVGTHRRKKYTEFQGSDTFEKDGKVYLVVSTYSMGTDILDVTSPSQMNLVKNVPINDNPAWKRNFTFDVVCRYPYAYSTFTVKESYLFTEYDYRGCLCLDLSDLKNVSQTLCEIPEDVKSDVTTADNQPNKITQYGDKLVLNNSTKGILVFDIGESGLPEYSYCQSLLGRSAVNAVSAFEDGTLFVGDTYSGKANYTNYPDYGIYWYQFDSGKVELSKSMAIIEKGKTFTLKATVAPSYLGDKSVRWESSDKNIATVSSNGKVKGIKTGTAIITCTSIATGASAACNVTVGHVKLSQYELVAEKGKIMKLKAAVYPSSLEDRSVTWTSSESKIVKVASNGMLKGVKAGTATITCTSNATGLSASCEVLVGYVKLSQYELVAEKGKIMKLKAAVYPSSLEDRRVTWTSSDSKIVKVASNGMLKGVKAGTATITCTSNATGLSASCIVTVLQSPKSVLRSQGVADMVTSFNEIESSVDTEPFDVYDLSGPRRQVTSLDGLPNGIYIVNGKKILKK